MGVFDDHVAVMGDWMPPSPSPRSFLSPRIGDDVVARSVVDSDTEIRSQPPFQSEEQITSASGNSDQKDQDQASSVDGDEASNLNALAEPRLGSCGGLMERIAARAGFNALRLNTESIRPADPSKKQEVKSPYLTIPPGLSPTTLLDSPVFLPNSLVLPSPTTGQFLFDPSGYNRDCTLMTANPEKGKENTFEDVIASSFTFKPVAESASFPYFNAANKSFPGDVAISVHSDTSHLRLQSENNNALFQQANFSKIHTEINRGNNLLPEQTHSSVGVVEHSPPFVEQHQDGDQRSSGDPSLGGSASEDGYNWRKYGQKHVKGSEFPRSYYKCTHQNCPVKKKVERSHEGHITEIIYKGAHNHPKPPPNRRSALGSSNALGDMQLDSEQPGAGATDWKPDTVEATSSTPVGQQFGNGAATALQSQSGAQYELGDGVDGSTTFSNDDEEDDRATHGSVSLGYEVEGDELESKRRRVETYAPEMSGAIRAIREPRVVVQTTSEVDILDDGYRWRKYGQKVVKGNPNPRSYYKCTSPGCNVRKHVERACHDLQSVITTYEGKHNHDVPAARNSGQMNSGGSNTLSNQNAPAISSHIHRPESSQIRGSTAWFERPPLASFGLPGRPQLGACPNFGFGMNQHGLASLANQSQLPVHPYLGHEARPVNNIGYMLPKGEPKMEPVTDTALNYSSNGSSLYQQLMSRLPLGPQM